MAMTQMNHIAPFQDATPYLEKPEKLRAFANEKGYLFFKGLLPENDVLNLRKQIITIVQTYGWLAPKTPPLLGLAAPDAPTYKEGTPEWRDFYSEVQKLNAFHALALHRLVSCSIRCS